MLSLGELRRAARVLDATVTGGRVQRIVQPDEASVGLSIYVPASSGGTTRHLLLSCRAAHARVSLLDAAPHGPRTPLLFAQHLRAHLDGARVRDVHLVAEDRQLAVGVETDAGIFELLLSLLGPRSNVYLLDGDGVLRAALRALDVTRPELALGQPWSNPASVAPAEGVDRWESEPDAEYLAAIERHYGPRQRAAAAAELSRRVAQAFTREAAFLQRKLQNLDGELRATQQAGDDLRRGELLKTVLHQARPGATTVTATDYSTGEEVVIPLDPKLSAAKNLERYFKRYQKATRGAAMIEEQLRLTRHRRGQLEDLRSEFDGIAAQPAENAEAIEAFAARPAVRALLRGTQPQRRTAPPPAKTGKKSVPVRLLPKRYRSASGLEIWVGRTDEGNDYLTTRLARGNDLFFHLDGSPGSHVILRTGGRSDPPPEAMIEACELAVHFSKQKEANRADVHVAPVKNISKPRGAKPGLVHVRGGKTIHLRRDPGRLQRVLAARVEEE